ncbi:hypothetical protein ABE28_003135 [Peribacillus muralis]|uniref:Uncharacterized protein n=1 Tax=Peribacillus muralis TaxID=264697 RepID=A0A1B3XJD7_9BACI|nr:hypothetical protein [Peribacillus muralis]AOH53333.1 hypothetical protein ABE28_003135 [Peribacillus muralis]
MAKVQPVVIRRQQKHEAEQAIEDLLVRGFEIVSSLKQENQQSEVLNIYSFEQKRFQVEDYSSPWIAKMMRVVQ